MTQIDGKNETKANFISYFHDFSGFYFLFFVLDFSEEIASAIDEFSFIRLWSEDVGDSMKLMRFSCASNGGGAWLHAEEFKLRAFLEYFHQNSY